MVKTFDDIKDNSRQRWIDLNIRSNIPSLLSEEEREHYKKERENILDKYPNKEKNKIKRFIGISKNRNIIEWPEM